jgi:hypothetical protein
VKNIFARLHIEHSWSISTSAQYVTLDNQIKCLSLAVFNLATPPINWNSIYVGTTNSKSLGQTIMIDQSEILSRSQVQLEVDNCVAPFTSSKSLGQTIMIDQSEILSRSQVQLEVDNCVASFTSVAPFTSHVQAARICCR